MYTKIRNKITQSAAIFKDKYPLIGPTFWVLSIQYYLTQLVVALDWAHPYSLASNTISDLGNTLCGQYGERLVCSPLHNAMNASFIVLGATMIAGSTLIYQEFSRSRASAFGFGCMAAAGFGTILVGLFPENTISALHVLGAGLPFSLGNVAMIVLGLKLRVPTWLRAYSVFSGTVALVALVLFIKMSYAGLGVGGMERVVAYPQTLWLIVFGLYMSRDRFKRR